MISLPLQKLYTFWIIADVYVGNTIDQYVKEVLVWPDRRAINTLRSRQNGRHFADDILKYIFLNENIWILNESMVLLTI